MERDLQTPRPVADAAVGDRPMPAFDLGEQLESLGQEVEASGNRPFSLNAPAGAWWVRSGRLEVFALGGDGGGRRVHVATFEAGDLVLSLRPGGALELLAVGHPDTHLSRVSADTLKELARRPEAASHLARLVERWVQTLPRELLRDRPPKDFRELEPGQEAHLPDGDLAARTVEGVVWVRHVEGASRFLGRHELALSAGEELVPISEESWLVSAEEARLSCVETAFLLRSGRLWESLDRFHQLALSYLELVLGEARDDERDRLGEKASLDRRTLAAAHSRLASVLAQKTPGEVAADSGADPLLAACRLVGREQGIRFVAPRESASGPGAEEAAHRRLAAVIAASRVRHRRVLLRDHWWRRDNGPLLAFRAEGGEPVALLPAGTSRYDAVDPRDGRRVPVDEAFAAQLDAGAVMFYPPLPERAVGVRDLLATALRGRRSDLLTLLLMGLAGGLVALLLPLLTGHLFKTVIPASDRRQLLQVTLALVVGAVAGAGFQVTRAIAVLRLSGKIDGSLQAAVWNRLMDLPVPFFRRYSVGDLTDRVMGIDAIRELLTGHVITSVLGSMFSLFSFALLFYYSWPLALVASLLVALLGGSAVLFGVLQVRHQRDLAAQRGAVASLVFGLINGIAKIRVAGAEHRAYGLWAEGFSRQRRSTIAARRIANLQAAWSAGYGLLTAGGLFAMVVLSRRAELPASEFLAFNAAFGQFQSAALSVLALLPGLLTAVPTYERLKPILVAAPEVGSDKAPAGEIAGDVELSHVSFRYQADGPLILDDLSFRVRPGELVALVGPSGAGKSTVLRLLLGFETPEAGSIYFDGQDLAALDLTSLRRQIGVVLQGSRPLAGDLFANIVGSRNLTIDDAWDALRKAGLEEDVRALPMGLHTIVSEDASTFSGGQLQRMLIARAIVHRPRILLLDEATSALDNPTQDHVTRGLERLKATRIVVAHRLSTIQNADRIVVLERGRAVESGTYDSLMARDGLFRRLASRQLA